MSFNQSSAYLFTDSGRAALESFLDEGTLFAFDLDGTLAPIVSDPGAIGIPDPVRKEIALLGKKALVAVITGRSRLDALRHLAFEPSCLIGNHGAEGLPGWEDRTRRFIVMASEWQKQLSVLLPPDGPKGVTVENKGPTLSLHYRRAGDVRSARALILEATRKLTPPPRRISGKYVENLIPEGAPDKGVALALLMRHSGCPKAFFTGDDETDEDVFAGNYENIFTVRIGRRKTSRARYYLRSQREMVRLLREINKILQRFNHKKQPIKD